MNLGERRGCAGEQIAEVEVDRVPARLRLPSTRVVAVTGPGGVLRVEEGAEALARLGLEEEVRSVLNGWDPIGVADHVDDEYDACIPGVLGLLRAGASDQALAEQLLTIERERMELPGTSIDYRLAIASRLQRLLHPGDAGRGHL